MSEGPDHPLDPRLRVARTTGSDPAGGPRSEVPAICPRQSGGSRGNPFDGVGSTNRTPLAIGRSEFRSAILAGPPARLHPYDPTVPAHPSTAAEMGLTGSTAEGSLHEQPDGFHDDKPTLDARDPRAVLVDARVGRLLIPAGDIRNAKGTHRRTPRAPGKTIQIPSPRPRRSPIQSSSRGPSSRARESVAGAPVGYPHRRVLGPPVST